MSEVSDKLRFALSHLTFERNSAMGTEGNNGIQEAEKLLEPLGWRWVTAELVPRREIRKEHIEYAEAVEGLQLSVKDLLHELYMGVLPDQNMWDDLEEQFNYVSDFNREHAKA